ncbi:hypothetical protein M0R45_025145 [Rubus argutus]|uniref:RRM domain-containing protein n=1 Tax=Rubus argutus TaxID=59490 RepID=A0AAW1WUK8_RUBAR
MGRKKPKEPESDAVSDNPFRRKNQEPGLGLGFAAAPSLETVGNVNNGGSEDNADNGEVKKRKKKAMDLVTEEASETPLESRKSKKLKKEKPNLESPNLSSELNSGVSSKGDDIVSKLVLGLGSNTENNPNLRSERKGGDGVSVVKKRKRDELEREYEAKKYGATENHEDGDKDLGKKVVGEKRKTVDNPADMLKKKVLIREFGKFGEVESVRIRSVPIEDIKAPRKVAVLTKKFHEKGDSVNAYIVFKSEESAQASLSHNMAVVEGHHIRVDRACPPRKKLKGENTSVYDHKRTVFVGNLPFEVKDEEVYQLFCGINNRESGVEAIRIVRDSNVGLGKGIAYVLFKTKEAANAVVKKRNLKLQNRELRLSHAKPESILSKSRNQDSTPSKRSNPSSASNAKSPAKRPAVGSRTPEFKGNSKATMSYQGAKAASQGGAASKQAGVKRKMDSRTPPSSHEKKKFKKFR